MRDFDFVRQGFIQAQESLAALRVTAPTGEIFLLQGVQRKGTISAPELRQSVNPMSVSNETIITISSTRDQYTQANRPKPGHIVKTDTRYIIESVATSGHHYKIVAYDPQTRNTE